MAVHTKRIIIQVLLDLLILLLSFLLVVWIKPGEGHHYITGYQSSFLVFCIIWIVISLLGQKYRLEQSQNVKKRTYPILLSNFIILGSLSIFIFLVRDYGYSRFIFFGTILTATTMELLLGNLYYHVQKATVVNGNGKKEYRGIGLTAEAAKLETLHDEQVDFTEPEVKEYIKNTILEECGPEGFHFLNHYALLNNNKTLILATTTRFNIESREPGRYRAIINLHRINDIRRINKFFETANAKLTKGGTFIGCVETHDKRREKILGWFIFPFNYLYYYCIDFPVKRIFPKFGLTKKVYFFITRGNNRVISRAETLGRLISCGFEIQVENYIGPLLYIVAQKTGEPHFDMHASYGPFVRLQRIGKNGEIIKVLKMRTMYPYAEYLQDYVYRKNKLENGGKFKADFRISKQGRFMRRFWLDEMPMLYNWLKGEMKLVGVRPLSRHYFSLYSKELQEKRIRHKPGLIPPYYADLPETLEEIQTSELMYLDAYENKPFKTDWIYFWKALYNIIFKHARSS